MKTKPSEYVPYAVSANKTKKITIKHNTK
uniref:Uncharacterized protein n=1 Tax=Rhizophora mucronata TaxID=61149 RepID=A0A2P2MF38_RHIMU